MTLVIISVLNPILKDIDLFKPVIRLVPVWAVPRTPSYSLWTLNLLLTSSIFRTSICSVPIPIISLGTILCLEILPAIGILVTIPVAPVVPIPVFKNRKEVLNPIVCLPLISLIESVESPETVMRSPCAKPCGCVESPVTWPVLLLYENTILSFLTIVDAIETIDFPPTLEILERNPLPEPWDLVTNFSLTLYPSPEFFISNWLILPEEAKLTSDSWITNFLLS